MNELHLFAGAGGGILGGMLLGHTTVCAVEIEPYCQAVLRQRQADGILPPFTIFGDIREFDGTEWRGKVDVVCGGFPCQDISVAGRGAGITGERSGLWGEMARIIGEIQPRYAFVENSPMLTSRGLGRVLGDLSEMGYDAKWCVLGAHHCGAPHRRDRIWILAYPNCWDGKALNKLCLLGKQNSERSADGFADVRVSAGWGRKSESRVCRVAHGVANRSKRLKAIGNGQVPIVAATAFRLLSQSLTK